MALALQVAEKVGESAKRPDRSPISAFFGRALVLTIIGTYALSPKVLAESAAQKNYPPKTHQPVSGQTFERQDVLSGELSFKNNSTTGVNGDSGSPAHEKHAKKNCVYSPVPEKGCYLGVYTSSGNVCEADGLRRYIRETEAFERKVGKRHAVYLAYISMHDGDRNHRFPSEWVEWVKQRGGIAQIALEPRFGLKDIDEKYLREFAMEAAKSACPIYLRFASEMNGAWVPWYGNAGQYKRAFRRVHDIMQQEAPNVFMVWSVMPNQLANADFKAYYPGRKNVDIVGVSLYENPFSMVASPTRLIAQINAFAMKEGKPLVISEGSVCTYYVKKGKHIFSPRTLEADARLLQEIYSLPGKFPNLKAITLYNLDAPSISRRYIKSWNITRFAIPMNAYVGAIARNEYLSSVPQRQPGKHSNLLEMLDHFILLVANRKDVGDFDFWRGIAKELEEKGYGRDSDFIRNKIAEIERERALETGSLVY